MKPLTDKKILITGASKRIGRELALTAAREGAFIFLHYSSSEADAYKTQQEIKGLGTECQLIRADFSDPQKAMPLFEKIFADFHTLDPSDQEFFLDGWSLTSGAIDLRA